MQEVASVRQRLNLGRAAAILLDPLLLAPLFFLLLGLYVLFFFPRLTFSLADVLGLTVEFSSLSIPEIVLVYLLRGYFVIVLVRAIWRRSLLSAGFFSSALLYLCYFPVAWGWLGWFALVPLLCLARSEAPARRIYLYAWYAGVAFFWPILEWMRVADLAMYGTWAMLASYCSLYFAAAIFLIRCLDRGTSLPLVVTVPVVWTGLEFVRSFLLSGFAWYFLGHTQQAFVPLIQIADLAGAYLVSLLAAAVNAWLFEWCSRQGWLRNLLVFSEEARPAPGLGKPIRGATPDGKLALQGFVVFGLVVASLFYGFWRLEQARFEPGPRMALLQGNLDQRLRNAATGRKNIVAVREVKRHYDYLEQIALTQGPAPELIVWPETSYPYDWFELSPHFRFPKEGETGKPFQLPRDFEVFGSVVQQLVPARAKEIKTHLLLGVNTHIWEGEDKETRYNSALLVTPSGNWGPRYDKIHRIPFGEFVPPLPFMELFAPYDFPYSITPGEHLTRFPLGQYHFGVVICNEDTDPVLARRYNRKNADGPAVDFLINIGNESWFDGTTEHDEHLAICRFRAIECRRAVARAVNMGISAVIDGNGRILQPSAATVGVMPLEHGFRSWQLGPMGVETQGALSGLAELPASQWSHFKKVPGVLTATIPVDSRSTIYALLGDWLPWTCWAVIVAGLMWAIAKRIRQVENKRPMA